MSKRFISAVLSAVVMLGTTATAFAEESADLRTVETAVTETTDAVEASVDVDVESTDVTEIPEEPTEVVTEQLVIETDPDPVETELVVIETEIATETTTTVTEVTTTTTTEPDRDPVIPYFYNNQMSVFDTMIMKRSILAGEDTYDMYDYKYVEDSLLRRREGKKVYAKTVVIEYEKDGYPMMGYNDPTVLDSKIANGGGKLDIPQHTLQREGSSHGGWMYDGEVYVQGEVFTVPMVDRVVFTPYWFVYHKVTYYAGDYDDVVEYPSVTLQGTEGLGLELADTSRFTRPGYSLVGWKCSVDGLSYGPTARYIVPDTDVVFTAVWEKTPVTLSLSANNGVSTDKITDTVYAGDKYVLPECTFTNGEKEFLGWVYNKVLYQPGDELTVPALLPGLGVVITAYWSK